MNRNAAEGNDMEVEHVAPEPIQVIEIPLYVQPVAVDLPQDHADLIAPEAENNHEPATQPVDLVLHDDPKEAPTSNTRKSSFCEDNSDDDGSLCPICFDNWTNTGEHRVVSLKCGHVFGNKCLNRWFTTQGSKTCPTCKKRVGRNDVRRLYVKKLIAVDASELEDTKRQLQTALQERNHLQSELNKFNLRERLLNQEISLLKVQLNSKNIPALTHSTVRIHENVRLYMDKSLEVCKFGGSRVFDVNTHLDLAVVSMKSPTNLFNGYSVKKISITNYKPISVTPLHSLQIRDICFHKDNNLIMTVSMDKTFKIHDNHSNTVCYQYSHDMPLWSCCWDSNNSSALYIGTQTGAVLKYDVRRLAEPVCSLSIEGDMSPVVSVASIPASPGQCLHLGGVVSCKLNSLWLYENVNEEHVRHSLPLEGPFISMKYQTNTKQLLVSSRPNSRVGYARHTLCTLDRKENDRIDCNVIHEFQGGGMQKLLSKSCFLSHQGDYVAAHQENTKSVFLWSINTGEKVCSVPAHDAALDLKGLQNRNGHFLVSLTEKKLEFFKFIS